MYYLPLFCLGLCFLTGPLLAQSVPEGRHVLKGRIIRALAIEPGDPNHILVGQKGGKPVIHLHISSDRLYAGTWGDGLHILPLSAVLP